MFIASSLFDSRTGWLTALLIAGCPYFVYMILTAGSDTLFLLMLTVSVLLLVRTLQTPTRWGFLLIGVAIGLATLTRAVPLLLPVYLLPFLLLRYRDRALRGVAAWMLVMTGFAATIAPWTIRNYVHFHRLVPVQTLGGYHLYRGAVDHDDGKEPGRRKAARNRGSVEKDSRLYRETLRRVVSDPMPLLHGMGRRMVRMWYASHSERAELAMGLANAVLLGFAAAGTYLSRGRWRSLLPIYALISYFVLVHSVLASIFRYLIPVVPALLMLASVALVTWLGRAAPISSEAQ
jgi:4-amino-4-deoxy-L-arabinose transferase-like glycosyltransferase